MKAVILAGGFGTRISEETDLKPKPMVEIGGKPVLWHIMKIYSAYNINEFIICLGYKGYIIKEYFANYFLHQSDVTIDINTNKLEVHNNFCEPWRVTLIDTGDDTMTGGRMKRVEKYVKNETFHFTYGDGISDVNIDRLHEFHRARGLLATVTAVRPPGKFGALDMEKDRIIGFQEKPPGGGGWINGGFFVLEPEVFRFIKDDKTMWEEEPLEEIAKNGQLSAFKHEGFWQPMDTLRDRIKLEALWGSGNTPWRLW